MAAAATGTLLLGVVIGVFVPRSNSAQAEMTFTSQLGLIARGTPVPTSALVDVVFFKKAQGFALAVHGSQTVLASSSDAGDTWHVVNSNLPSGYPAQLEFADASHGFLWGGPPSSSGTVPLWVSSDGGRSWTIAPIGPVVSDVSAIRGDVWAVVGTCAISSTAPTPSCAVGLEVSPDFGASWAPSTTYPPLNENSSVSISDQDIELARISHTRAYVLAFASSTAVSATSSPGGSGHLAYTEDSGASWTMRPDPCPSSFSIGQQLAASSTADLWLLCSSEGSAGSQAKALYRSDDGGQAWTLAAAGNAPVLSSEVRLPAGGGLPSSGYLAPYSLGHDNLAVVSNSTAWLFPDRAGVFDTLDGGKTWKLAQSLAQAGMVVGGSGNVVFVDATHGWVCEVGSGLWRTTDGLHWQRITP